MYESSPLSVAISSSFPSDAFTCAPSRQSSIAPATLEPLGGTYISTPKGSLLQPRQIPTLSDLVSRTPYHMEKVALHTKHTRVIYQPSCTKSTAVDHCATCCLNSWSKIRQKNLMKRNASLFATSPQVLEIGGHRANDCCIAHEATSIINSI